MSIKDLAFNKDKINLKYKFKIFTTNYIMLNYV